MRVAAFLGIAGFVAATPALDHVLHLRWRWVPSWHMYASVGRGVCDVTYFDGDAPIDRTEVLHGGPWWALEPWQRRVSVPELDDVGAALCDRPGLEDVRAEAWCAGPQRWRQVRGRERNLCR